MEALLAGVHASVKTHPESAAVWASPWSSTHPLIERIRMLSPHRPSATRRRVGLSLAAIAALAGAGLACAGLESKPASTGRYADVRMKLRIDGREFGTPRIIVELGQQGSLAFSTDGPGSTEPRWVIAVTTTREADGRLKVVSRFSAGSPEREVASHTQVANEGELITLRETYPGPRGHLEMERVVRTVDALPGK